MKQTTTDLPKGSRNPEGYPDPTATAAIANITREERAKQYMPLVYIASPFAGDTQYNTERARNYCRLALSKGYIPLAPHLHYPQFMDEDNERQRELGLRFALILMGKCDELWAFGTLSEGMRREIAKAKRRNMPIRFFNNKGEEVSGYGD